MKKANENIITIGLEITTEFMKNSMSSISQKELKLPFHILLSVGIREKTSSHGVSFQPARKLEWNSYFQELWTTGCFILHRFAGIRKRREGSRKPNSLQESVHVPS